MTTSTIFSKNIFFKKMFFPVEIVKFKIMLVNVFLTYEILRKQKVL